MYGIGPQKLNWTSSTKFLIWNRNYSDQALGYMFKDSFFFFKVKMKQ